MLRYFYVNGNALKPARFWAVGEIDSKTTLLEIARKISQKKIDGHIQRIKNEDVDYMWFSKTHGFKTKH